MFVGRQAGRASPVEIKVVIIKDFLIFIFLYRTEKIDFTMDSKVPW